MAKRILATALFLTLASLAATPRFSMEVPAAPGAPPISALSGIRFQKGSGNILLSANARAFLWEDGSTSFRSVDLPLLDENGFGTGSVLCASSVEVQIYCGLIFAGGKTYELGSFGLGAAAGDFNRHGEFVGRIPSGIFSEPILWREGQVLKLNELLNGTNRFHEADVINDAGVIYGKRYIAGTGTTAMLVRLTPDGKGRYDLVDLYEFNDTALVLSKDGRVAVMGLYWSGETGPLSFGLGVENRAWPHGVNSFGEVAGGGYLPGDQNFHGFFWDGNAHVLNDLVDLPAGWSLADGTDLNDYGQIAADAYTGEQHVPVRLTPEPRMTLRVLRPGAVEALIRPGARRAIALETSADLRHWTAIRDWPSPTPLETEQITSGNTAFFRVVRL